MNRAVATALISALFLAVADPAGANDPKANRGLPRESTAVNAQGIDGEYTTLSIVVRGKDNPSLAKLVEGVVIKDGALTYKMKRGGMKTEREVARLRYGLPGQMEVSPLPADQGQTAPGIYARTPGGLKLAWNSSVGGERPKGFDDPDAMVFTLKRK